MRTNRLLIFFTVTLAAMILSGCFPFGPESVEEFDIVATFYNENFSFGSVRTFAMPDSVMHVRSDGLPGDDPNISRSYDSVVLTQVASNMTALGYERVDPDSQATDVLLTVSVTSGDLDLYSGYPYSDYWGWYSTGYGYENGYEYYYPGYGSGSYSVRTGTLIIHMIDPNQPVEDDQKLPSVWIGLINGLTSDNSLNVRKRLVDTINQCFVQSSYLGASSSQ
jgi:hypothetical protein